MKTYKMKINGNAYEVAVKNIEGTNVEVEVNGKAYNVELEQSQQHLQWLVLWHVQQLLQLQPLLLHVRQQVLQALPVLHSQAQCSASR